MRILQVIPGADSFRVFLAELVEHVIEEGHGVCSVFNPSGGIADYPVNGPGRIQSVEFPRGGNPLRHLKSAKQLVEVVEEFEPDIVHAHFSAGILSAALARRNTRIPCQWIGTYQGLQFPFTTGVRGQLTRFAESWSAGVMDQVQVLTDDDVSALRRSAPKANVIKQEAFGFGCHDRFFDTPIMNDVERERFRVKLGLEASDRVFLFVGRMVAHKGFHHAARAFMQAHATCSDLKWIVVGESDPLHPTGLSEEEWAIYQQHPAIIRMGVQDDVLPYMDVADALLFPTQREGMPVSVMESLARRTPVLTNAVRGCRELVEASSNGYFFTSLDSEEMAKILVDFSPFLGPEPNPLTRRSIWVRQMLEIYTELLTKSNRSA